MQFMTPLERKVLNSITVVQYYSDYIRYVDEKFKFAFDRGDKAICPIHEDNDPSFGLMKDKQNKGVMLYHCFGCNRVGNVIRLHQFIEKQYKGNDLEYQEAAEDLAKLYKIEVSEADMQQPKAVDVFTQRQMMLRKAQEGYSFKDYQLDMLALRLGNKTDKQKIMSINRNLVKLINKELSEE